MPPEPISADLLRRYPTREAKLGRIRELQRELERMEKSDETNDPILLDGLVSQTRGVNVGCGVGMACAAAMCASIIKDDHKWAIVPAVLFGALALFMMARGILYRPDIERLTGEYTPNRTKDEYKALVNELEQVSRALVQDMQPGD